jgi:uncharacterized protein (DUF58 family)
MIFTRRFYLVLIIGGGIAWASVAFVSLEAALRDLVILDLLWVFLAAIDYGRVRPQQIEVKRQLEPRLSIGRENRIHLLVKTLVPPPPGRSVSLQIQDFHPPDLRVTGLPLSLSLGSTDQLTLSYAVHPHDRGVLTWPQLQVQQLGAWGLVWRRWRIPQSQSTKVYPDLVGLRELSIRLALESSGSLRYRRPWGLGTEFAELREYDRGDDPRLIDWKATARRGKPLIRVLEPEQEQTLLILLDGGRLMTAQVQGLQRFDWGLNTALSLALAGLNRGDRVGVGVFDRTLHTWVPPQRGQPHLSRLLETLTPLQPTLQEPDYLGAVTPIVQRQTRRALVVIITDILDPIASSELLSALLHLSPRYLPFCVTLRDPILDRFATTPTLEIEGAYQRSVALDLLAQRELAFAKLRQQGVLVLDAPAPSLSTALVNGYLQLKMKGRL